MARNEVTIVLSAQDAEQVRAWQRSKQGIKETAEELSRAGRSGRRAGREVKEGFKEAKQTLDGVDRISAALVTRFTGVGAAIAGITKFAQLIKSEYEELVRRQQESSQAQVDVFPSYARAAATLPGLDPGEMYKQVVGGSRGINPGSIFEAIEAGSAARGNLPEQAVVDAALASARHGMAYDDATRNAWVAAALENMKTFGGSAEENLALQSEAFRASRAKDPGAFFRNVAPAIPQTAILAGGKKDFRTMASHVIGIGAAMGDQEGGPSATASVQLVRQVVTEAVMSGKAKMEDDYEKKLAVVRSDPAIQRKLLGVFAQNLGTTEADLKRAKKAGKGELAIEAKAFSAAVGYLSSDQNEAKNLTASEIQSAAGKISSPQKALANLAALNERISKAGPGPTAGISQADQQRENLRKFGDTKQGQMGQLLEFYGNRMKDMREFQTYQYLQRAQVWATSDSPEEMAETIRKRLRERATDFTIKNVSPEAKESAKEILKMTETLEKMLAIMEEERGPKRVEVINGRTNQPVPPGAAGLAEPGNGRPQR